MHFLCQKQMLKVNEALIVTGKKNCVFALSFCSFLSSFKFFFYRIWRAITRNGLIRSPYYLQCFMHIFVLGECTNSNYIYIAELDCCYKLYDDYKTWNETQTRCLSEDAQLVVLDTAEKDAYIKSYFKNVTGINSRCFTKLNNFFTKL